MRVIRGALTPCTVLLAGACSHTDPAPAPAPGPAAVVAPDVPNAASSERPAERPPEAPTTTAAVADRAAARVAFRKAEKAAGRFAFIDLSYAADPRTLADFGWTQSDPPPFTSLTEEAGVQFHARWTDAAVPGAAVELTVTKFPHVAGDGKSRFTFTFERAGIVSPCFDLDRMLKGTYLDEKLGMADVAENRCVEPTRRKVGPATVYASVVGTGTVTRKRERQSFYAWTDAGRTWIAKATVPAQFLEVPGIEKRAEELLGTLRALDAPR